MKIFFFKKAHKVLSLGFVTKIMLIAPKVLAVVDWYLHIAKTSPVSHSALPERRLSVDVKLGEEPDSTGDPN